MMMRTIDVMHQGIRKVIYSTSEAVVSLVPHACDVRHGSRFDHTNASLHISQRLQSLGLEVFCVCRYVVMADHERMLVKLIMFGKCI